MNIQRFLWLCIFLFCNTALIAQVKYKSLKDALAANPNEVEYLDLSSQEIKSFPKEILQLTNLKTLVLSDNQLRGIPDEVAQLKNLENLYLSGNKLTSLPKTMSQMKSLKTIGLNHNRFENFPEILLQSPNLQMITLESNQLKKIPENINAITNLKQLNLQKNQITSIPTSLFACDNLVFVYLDNNKINTFSTSGQSKVKKISLENNKLTTLPQNLNNLQDLEELNLKGNDLSGLPESIGELKNLKNLDLYKNNLMVLPLSIINLKNIEKMNLGWNSLENLPDEILAWLSEFTFDMYNPTVKKQINEYKKRMSLVSKKENDSKEVDDESKKEETEKDNNILNDFNAAVKNSININQVEEFKANVLESNKDIVESDFEEGMIDGGESNTPSEEEQAEERKKTEEVETLEKQSYKEVLNNISKEIDFQMENLLERNKEIEKEIIKLKSSLDDNKLSETDKNTILEQIKKLEKELLYNRRLYEQLANSLQKELSRIEDRLKNDEEYSQTWIWSLSIIILILVLIVLVVWFIARTRRKQKEQALKSLELINAQKQEIQEQHETLSQKNSELENAYGHIKSSLLYAQRIQSSILEQPDVVISNFTDGFILYLPKDIVSGDFYWFSQQGNKKILAAVDCTGHGVPGAFMTMMGNLLLNEIVNQEQKTSPSLILKELDQGLRRTLRQEENKFTTVQDGMDLMVLCIDEKEKLLHFAGAKSYFYSVKDDTVEELKGSNYPVGSSFTAPEQKDFPETTINLTANQVLYLFSDGFQDQLGGKRGRKFMKKRFRELLLNNHNKDFKEQAALLKVAFDEWKMNEEQTDDILVIGIKV